jgi:hypothetical protein
MINSIADSVQHAVELSEKWVLNSFKQSIVTGKTAYLVKLSCLVYYLHIFTVYVLYNFRAAL